MHTTRSSAHPSGGRPAQLAASATRTPQVARPVQVAQPPVASTVPAAVRPTAAHAALDPLLTPAEVAALFRVDPKTVTRWADAGKITTVRTLGGHRRYSQAEIRTLLSGVPTQRV